MPPALDHIVKKCLQKDPDDPYALSPDGARLAVSAEGGTRSNLWIQPTSGSGSPKPLLEKTSFTVTGWSPDGALLIGSTQEAETVEAFTEPIRLVRNWRHLVEK